VEVSYFIRLYLLVDVSNMVLNGMNTYAESFGYLGVRVALEFQPHNFSLSGSQLAVTRGSVIDELFVFQVSTDLPNWFSSDDTVQSVNELCGLAVRVKVTVYPSLDTRGEVLGKIKGSVDEEIRGVERSFYPPTSFDHVTFPGQVEVQDYEVRP